MTALAPTILPLADGLTREFLLHRRLAPVALTEDGFLVVKGADAGADEDLAELGVLYSAVSRLELAPPQEVEQLIERLAHAAEQSMDVAAAPEEDELTADARGLASQPPVIRYVNLLIREAYDAGASDIHLDSVRGGVSVRFRLDGILTPAPEPPSGLHLAAVSRIKLLAQIDIAERRRPQDGRIRVRMESRELDLRVSTVPALFGESVVLRLLERGGRPVGLDDLGMGPELLQRMERLAERPHGLLLVTGPTGSGKTTTLYAAIARRARSAEKIITVEDPIEYQLPGVTQVPVQREAGTTFAAALRSILRQDPDVLMIGEMRDSETAELAIQAAMTGHLVLSTLHTNDALGAIPRLLDLGIPAYLVAATLEGVVAQRLVRRVCDGCRSADRVDPAMLALVAPASAPTIPLWRGNGCPQCRGTGYRGRVGLFELVEVDDRLRDVVSAGAGRSALRGAARFAGHGGLRADGWSKIEAGLTTVEEVVRVIET